jgi:hypothetical protein
MNVRATAPPSHPGCVVSAVTADSSEALDGMVCQFPYAMSDDVTAALFKQRDACEGVVTFPQQGARAAALRRVIRCACVLGRL